MRTYTVQKTTSAAAERPGAPIAPVGIPILSSRTKVEIGRVRRDGGGWAAFGSGTDGAYRPLGIHGDFSAALAVIPDPEPDPGTATGPVAVPPGRHGPVPAKRPTRRPRAG